MSVDNGSPGAPVVVAGGGPVGIGTALELARHGVPTVVLETRRRGECYPARTNLTNLRSMEHFRRWGIADQLRRNDPVGEDFVRSITYVTALNGHIVIDLARLLEFDYVIPFSSDRPEWAPNAGIEVTMQEAALADPLVDIRFGCTVTGFEQLDDSVRVRYTDADHTDIVIDAQYLVGADGSRSLIRSELGIRMAGVPDLALASIWHIHAPGLKDRMDVGRSSFLLFINEFRDNALMIAQDSDDNYMFSIAQTDGDADPNSWDDARKVLYRNVGFEFEVTPVSGGAVRIHSLLAPEFRCGRVFLVGDAAHLVSPMGGFGMNLGIGDAADLGWKLAAVLQGWGGPALLDSYGNERRPVISWILDTCIGNTERSAASFTQDGICDDTPYGADLRTTIGAQIMATKVQEFQSLGAQLGTNYHGSDIVVPDGTDPPPLSQGNYHPCATPGCRAPHVWLEDSTSLYDHFGVGFTLLVTTDTPIDTAAFAIGAAACGLPLTVLQVASAEVRELYGAALALIRPDQHVAWRGDEVPDDIGAVLDTVRGAGAA